MVPRRSSNESLGELKHLKTDVYLRELEKANTKLPKQDVYLEKVQEDFKPSHDADSKA